MATWNECKSRSPSSGKKDYRPEAYGIVRTCDNCFYQDELILNIPTTMCDACDSNLVQWKEK